MFEFQNLEVNKKAKVLRTGKKRDSKNQVVSFTKTDIT